MATKQIYEDISAQIETYAKKNGFSVVFKVEKGEIESESKAELILKINSRGVLYFDPALEITGEIIRIMNEQYTGQKPTEKKEGEEKEGEGKEGEGKEGEGKGGEKTPGSEEKKDAGTGEDDGTKEESPEKK